MLFHIHLRWNVSISITIVECVDGTYGYNCDKNCSSHCLNNFPCNKQTGHCNEGCNPGYTNDNCSKGKFTDECVLWIVFISLGLKALITLYCLHSYLYGIFNSFFYRVLVYSWPTVYIHLYLQIECRIGHFGLDCIERCSGHCINNEPCEHVSGVCHNGGQDGFVGTYCNKCKPYIKHVLIIKQVVYM